jgi:hypothetical protein
MNATDHLVDRSADNLAPEIRTRINAYGAIRPPKELGLFVLPG